MNGMRKVLCFLMALMLATFAGSSIAATKTFYAQFQPFFASDATSYTATFYNNSPGPSTINSIKILAPTSGGVPLLRITNVSPGTAVVSADGSSAIINGIPGIKRGANQVFTISVSNIAPGCNVGTSTAFANAGNAYPQGDEFQPDPTRMKLTSAVGCEFTAASVPCGGFFEAGSAVSSDPGYVKVTIGDTLKDGTACPAGTSFGVDVVNTILIDDKVFVNLTGPQAQNAAFSVDLNSLPLPVDANGWASRRLRVAWQVNASTGSPIYIDGPSCVCPSLLLACEPIDTVSTDPYFGQQVHACVSEYSSMTVGPDSFGNALVRYFAKVIAVGNDPAFGWD